jgi:hypothetical protein
LPPYHHTRRLISAADVKNDAKRAHSSVQPGSASPKDGQGNFLYEDAWRYLFTHPADLVGEAAAPDPGCLKDQRGTAKAAATKPK